VAFCSFWDGIAVVESVPNLLFLTIPFFFFFFDRTFACHRKILHLSQEKRVTLVEGRTQVKWN